MKKHLLTTLILVIVFLQFTKVKLFGQKPNVLFILTDDLGYHDLSCTGSKYYETPNIDKIAHEGMVFTNGYSACQVSSPSRASILTGKFPPRHGITDFIGAKSGEEWREKGRFSKLLPADYKRELQQEFVTLPEAMKQAGYKTFFAGKWHLGGNGSYPENHGFDINKGGWETGSPIGGYFSPWNNPRLPNNEKGENLSLRLAKETVEFLKENNPTKTGQPVFAFLSFYAVHGPIETTQKKWSKYRNKAEMMGIATKAFKMGKYLPVRQVQDNPVYAGLVESMDDAVGVVLNALNDLGLDKNTIVVFTSDNGGVVSGDSYSTSNLPLRAGKGYQFEGGIRVPYFVKVPWLTKSGQKSSDVPVSGTDFYPTLLEITGEKLRPNDHEDGKSLLPLLKGKKMKERSLIWHYPHYGNQGGEPASIIRKGDWKLIYYYEDGREELYNLREDLEENYNVANKNPQLVKNLHHKLFGYLKKVGAEFPVKDAQYNSQKEQNYLEEVKDKNLPKLEKSRMNYLSKEYDPGNNWWGSVVTKD